MAKSIGRQIHDARVAKNLTLEDVRHQLKIPLNLLADIETDDYSNFANLTYAKCFLKLYSEYVGVNLEEYLSEFGTDSIGSLSSHGIIVDSDEAFSLGLNQKNVSEDSYGSETMKNPLWRGLAAILLIGGGIWTWQTFAPRAASATSNPAKAPNAPTKESVNPLATRENTVNSSTQ